MSSPCLNPSVIKQYREETDTENELQGFYICSCVLLYVEKTKKRKNKQKYKITFSSTIQRTKYLLFVLHLLQE